jgi:predicted nucleotidyltransferase
VNLLPELESDARAIREWAAATPVVRRAWLFGSRVRGSHRPDSDLDVAIEHDRLSGDASTLATWIGEAGSWRAELAPQLQHRLDLWSYDPVRTPKIDNALRAGAILIYERAEAPPNKGNEADRPPLRDSQ